MNRKVKKVLGYGLVSLMLCGPALVSKVGAEESGSIQTTAQFKNHKDGSQSVVGKTTPNTRLRIDSDGTIETVSDGEGNYELKIPEEKKYSKLNGGTINIYKVKNDGSSSFQTSTQTDFEAPQLYNTDRVAPRLSLKIDDSTFYALDYISSDKLEVKMIFSNGKIIVKDSDENGNILIDLPKLKIGEKVRIIATDAAGNSSEQEVVVEDIDAPSANHSSHYDNTPYQTISGRTYPNSKVFVSLPNGKELTTLSDINGYYSFDLAEENYYYPNEKQATVWAVRKDGLETPKTETQTESWGTSSSLGWYEFRVKENGTQVLEFSEIGGKKIELTLPNGKVISNEDNKENQKFTFTGENALKHKDKLLVRLVDKFSKQERTLVIDAKAPVIEKMNEVEVGDKVIGGIIKQEDDIVYSESDMHNSIPVANNDVVIVTLPDGTIRKVTPDKFGNWILSISTVKKGDVFEVRAKDYVGNISEPYIIKVGEAPSVVKPESNNKEEQKVDNEQGTNKETGEKSESKEKGKTEVKPTEEKGISSSQTGKNETSKETDLKVTDSTSSDKTLKSNSNVSKDQQTTSNFDRKGNKNTVVGDKDNTAYSNNTSSSPTSSVQKDQGKQKRSLPNTGTVNHLFSMVSGLVSFIVGSVIFRLKRGN